MKSIIRSICAKRILLKLVFFNSLFISFIFLVFFRNLGPVEHRVPGTDYFVRYAPIARQILDGQGIPLQKDDVVTGTPGYPLFLLPIFALSKILRVDELGLIVFSNAIVTAFGACFLFLLTADLFSKKIAFITSLLWSVYPLNLWFIKNPNTEVPFMLLFFIAIWLHLKGANARHLLNFFLVGILLGLALLVRPIALFLPLLFAGALFFLRWRKEQFLKILRNASILIGGSLCVIAPWTLYASIETGHFVPVSSLGPSASSVGLSYAFVGDGRHQRDVPSDVRLLMKEARDKKLERTNDIAVFVFDALREKPIPFLKLLLLKLMRSWYATYEMWGETQIIILQIPHVLLAIFGIRLAFKKFPNRANDLWFLLSIVCYFWLITFLSLSIVRYTIPAMALLMCFAAVSIERIRANLHSKFFRCDIS